MSARARLASVAALYGLAGAAAMTHEVLWARLLRTVLGGDARALAAALVAVLGGLGAGALLASRLARRLAPLTAFARVEAGAALYAAGLPWFVALADGPVGAALRALGPGPLFSVLSFVVATLLVAPAAIAFGAGLPLLAESVAVRDASGAASGRAAGVLYGSHAAGSAVGGLLAAFALLPDLGVPFGALIASALQLVAAGIALALAPRLATPAADAPAPRERATDPLGVWLLALAAAIAGTSTLALQSLWSRLAALAVGPTAQGFSLVSSAYVVALALGAAVGAAAVKRVTRPTLAYGLILLAACACALLLVRAAGDWPLAAADIFGTMTPGSGAPWARLLFLVAPVVVPPIALVAAAFPLGIAALTRLSRGRTVADVGLLSAAGALGNVCGALLMPFWLVPALGLARALVAATLALGLAGLVALGVALRSSRRTPPVTTPQAVLALAIVALCVLGLVEAPRDFDADALASGPFLYAGPTRPSLGRVLFTHDGPDATVTVRGDGVERLLQVDGKVDASAIGDAAPQALVGLLPALLAERTTRTLVIGLGTGATADALRSVPGTRRVDVAELVAGVRYAAPFFARATHSVLTDPRVHVHEVDGALYVRHAARQWDLTVSQPSNPWVAGVGDLFTEETFRGARARLAPHGVFAMWFHVYATEMQLVRDEMATFRRVFPSATLWEVARGEDYLLIGRNDERALDLDALAAHAAAPEVAERLARAGIPDGTSLLARLVAGPLGVARLAEGGETLSLRDGRLEARAARALYSDASRDALEAFSNLHVRPTRAELGAQRTPAGRALFAVAADALEAGALGRTLVLRATGGDEDSGIAAGERAIGLAPDDPSLRDALGTLYLARGKTHALLAEAELRAGRHTAAAVDVDATHDALLTVLELDPPTVDLSADALITLAEVDAADGEHERALGEFQRARRLRPNTPEIADGIAACLEALGDHADAVREHELARRLRD